VPGLIRLHGVEAREQGQPLRGRVYVQLQAPEDVADFLLSTALTTRTPPPISTSGTPC